MSYLESIYNEQFADHLKARTNPDVWHNLNEFDFRLSQIIDLLRVLDELITSEPEEMDKQCAIVESIFGMIGMLYRPWEAIFAYCREAEKSCSRSTKQDHIVSSENQQGNITEEVDELLINVGSAKTLLNLVQKLLLGQIDDPDREREIDVLIPQALAKVELSSAAAEAISKHFYPASKLGSLQ